MKFLFVLLSCLLFGPAIHAQTPASKRPANCTVQGQIVQEPGGRPIRKVGVSLLGANIINIQIYLCHIGWHSSLSLPRTGTN
jgi:hypothetical protein